VRFMITGSAPIQKEVLDYLKCALVCPIVEVYGMTEVTGPITMQYLSDNESGHVGGAVTGARVKLIDVPEMNYFAKGDQP
jgi:long-chain acyl-CoA synthetase